MAVLPIVPAQVKLGAGKHVINEGQLAGVAVAAGKVVYFDVATKRWLLGDSAALATAKIRGVSIVSADPEQPLSVVTKGKVIVGVGAAIRPGGTYVVLTNGDMVEENDVLHAIGKFTSIVGVGGVSEDIELGILASNVQLA